MAKVIRKLLRQIPSVDNKIKLQMEIKELKQEAALLREENTLLKEREKNYLNGIEVNTIQE